ncbi:hypothetical protein ACFL6C_12575 [Myxococcota bacterium]
MTAGDLSGLFCAGLSAQAVLMSEDQLYNGASGTMFGGFEVQTLASDANDIVALWFAEDLEFVEEPEIVIDGPAPRLWGQLDSTMFDDGDLRASPASSFRVQKACSICRKSPMSSIRNGTPPPVQMASCPSSFMPRILPATAPRRSW